MAIPGTVEMRWPALQWAVKQRGGYLSADLKAHLAKKYELTTEELAQTSDEGVPIFANNVDWVDAHFTEMGIHTSIDGQPRKTPHDRYFLTRYGYAVAEERVPWPTKRRNGPRGALPDPRQLAAG